MVKINLALAELPDFTADPGSNLQEHHTGSVEMAPTMEYIERAFQDAREGRPAARPFSDGVIPTAFDKTLCPEGTHIMSLFTQWVPDDWSTEPHTEELEAYADRMIDCYNELAPNFKASILHRDIVGPYEMEHEYGLVGGNIFHGELSLEQLFHMRPGARLRRLPHPGRRACTTAARPRTRAAASAASPAGRRPGPRSRTRRRRAGPGSCAGSPGGHDHQDQDSATRRPAHAWHPPPAPVRRWRRCWRRAASRWSARRRGRARSGSGWSTEVTRSPSRPEVHLVNPRYAEIAGRRCVPSLADLPARSTWSCSPCPTPRWSSS